MAVGIISHLHNPTFEDVRRLARASERAGADWLGLPDAFWWRDSWMLLAEVARVTDRLRIGPMVTNPYLRHPFHTVAAVATLQDLSGERVFVGLAAGGSEVTGAAGISRSDASERIGQVAALLRSVAAGEALDRRSGRTLEVALRPVRILVAGRADRTLEAAGRTGDQALLWAVPSSELDHSVGVIAASAAAGRSAPGPSPELVWAPLVDHGGASGQWARSTAAYSVLNSRTVAHQRWGLDGPALEKLRRQLVAEGAASATKQVPLAALEDLIVSDPDPARVAVTAARIGARSIAVPIFDLGDVEARVDWARQVVA